NNAGGSTAVDDTAVEAPLDEFWRAIKLDLYGTFLGCRFGIPELVKAGGGSVINMSSNVALMGIPGHDCYTAAKGGIAAITRSLAVAYALQKVRVNAIAPSATMTDRVKRLIAGNAALTKLADHRDTTTPQTPGMNRAAAINFARVGAQKIWAGTVHIHANAKTGAHHHGALESVIYVIKGRARMRWGEHLEYVAEANPGDFI